MDSGRVDARHRLRYRGSAGDLPLQGGRSQGGPRELVGSVGTVVGEGRCGHWQRLLPRSRSKPFSQVGLVRPLHLVQLAQSKVPKVRGSHITNYFHLAQAYKRLYLLNRCRSAATLKPY